MPFTVTKILCIFKVANLRLYMILLLYPKYLITKQFERDCAVHEFAGPIFPFKKNGR